MDTSPVFVLYRVVGGACLEWGGVGGEKYCFLMNVFDIWDWSVGLGEQLLEHSSEGLLDENPG